MSIEVKHEKKISMLIDNSRIGMKEFLELWER
jgi:hypothetical protein